ncbi:heat shock 70 kDa protein II-like isoform X2 [Planococcus citri]|uniref:heat shock 70 kDa protein II-like isoform X2 n=1 Tax=Planococcus citri TaxID=170843 RepID=UPI0031F8663A
MDAPAIGIDLGTTYSCVGVFQHGKVEIIANDQGDRTTPSCVTFTEIETLVGKASKNQSTKNLQNTVFDIKRLMGRKFDDETVLADMKHWPFQVIDDNKKPKIKVEFQGASRTYFPEEISSMVLRKMKETAEAYLGKPVKNAVITIPAYFNDSQRAATVDAAAIAGLNVLRIINEPTAAAIAYGLEKKNSDEQNVLIFDLGGGTFDVSILTIQNGVFQVISTAGDTHLGGEDIDNRMVNYFVKKIKRKYKKDLTQNMKVLQRLRTACEEAKRNLSSATIADIEIESLYDGVDFYSSISRARFEELNSDFFKSTMDLVEKAIKDAKIDKNQINHVVLVGGSSRIPKIQKMLQDFFGGKELNKSINPDEAVAYGAAIQAAILSGDQSEVIQNVVLFDVTPLSLGINVGADDRMSVVIKRNTTIPARYIRLYTTLGDDQSSMPFDVYEGEFVLSKDNNFLGRFDLTGIPVLPAGKVRVDVFFEIDANGILKVTAIDRETGSTNQITITYNRRRLSQDEIQRMINDAEKDQAKQRKRKAALAAKNSLKSYCINMKSTIQDATLKEKIIKFDRDMILKKCQETIAWLNSEELTEKELYERKLDELQNIFDVIISLAKYSGKESDKYFEILNVSKDASQSEINQAFRDKAAKYHPDKYQGDEEIGNMYWLTFMKAKDGLINLSS